MRGPILGRAMLYVVAGLFVAMGLLHLAYAPSASSTLAGIVTRWPAVRWLHPAVLVAIGAGILLAPTRRAACVAATLALATFTGVILMDTREPQRRGCGCMPDLSPRLVRVLDATPAAVARNAALIAMTVTGLAMLQGAGHRDPREK